MSALLALLAPAWLKAGLATAVALSGAGFFAWLKGKSAQAQVAHERDEVAHALAANHAVGEKEAAAQTDGDADAALDAAAHADHGE